MSAFHHFCAFVQVLQMYLPFCGISISNAKLFSESRKEYERSRVRKYQLCIYKKVLATGKQGITAVLDSCQ